MEDFLYDFGDKVLIKEDLVVGEIYRMENDLDTFNKFVVSMVDFKGEILKVANTKFGRYKLSKNNELYWQHFTDEMIEGKVVDVEKFEVGDKVVFRNDLEVGEVYGNITYLDSMKKDITEQIVTIKKIEKDGFFDTQYYVLTGGELLYYFSREMFEGKLITPMGEEDFSRVDIGIEPPEDEHFGLGESDVFAEMAHKVAKTVSKKNNDYGNSYDRIRKEYGHKSFLIRLADKTSRYETLMSGEEQMVDDESIQDTLEDIIGYVLLELNYLKSKEWFYD